jgi:DNA-binding Xre family transcriptional regulator
VIGLQELFIKQNMKSKDLAKQVGVSSCQISYWFNNNKIPKRHLKLLSDIFDIDEEYLNTQVNDICTYRPRKRGFNEYKIIGNIAEIYTTKRNGEIITIVVDANDIPKLIELDYCWCAIKDWYTKDYYVHSNVYHKDEEGNRIQSNVTLHSVILGEKYVDHIDHDGLNNCKDNLRPTEHVTNARNRRSRNSNNKSGFRNVSLRDDKWWVVQLQIEGKNTILKKFPLDKLDEAGAYAKEMRKKYYGDFAGEN